MKLFEQKKFMLTNSMTGKRDEFKTQVPGKVTFYSCGPTVYGPLHIGNARALIVADLFYRWFKYAGFDVNFVRNYTDVDDKIIVKANEEKISALEVANKYVDYCETDIKALGLLPPGKTVRVTETMPEIIAMIQKIISRKHAYVVDGEVFFAIDTFKEYGKLSGRNIEDLQAGARVEVDSKKKNPMDFSLWKPMKPGEPFWESPWGKGRPGWHIECSAMIDKYLGQTIDIHHGGQDLIFPHHENEIAQSEAASGVSFCNHWVHNAFLTMNNEKMSKSLGNILRIREFNEIYSPEILKYIYLAHHFRSGVDMSDDLILKVCDELERVYKAKEWAEKASLESGAADSAWDAVAKQVEATNQSIIDEMFHDLNTPGALGHIFVLIREINRVEAATKTKSDSRKKAAVDFLSLLKTLHVELWNVFGLETSALFKDLNRIRASMQKGGAMDASQIDALIEERKQARASKNFARSDEIRKELDAKGVVIIDSPQGTSWKYK